jgi:phage terminase large subunit
MEGKQMAIIVKPNYKPHPRQMDLHNAPVSVEDIMIIFFGGDRGGGKSAGILGDAIMFGMKYPKAKIAIIRETIDAVKQSFLDKLPMLFPQYVENGFKRHKLYDYKEKSSSFYPSRTILLPNGSYITLQPIADYRMAIAKQGWEFNYLAIDEITKHEERTFDYLLTTVRSAELTDETTGKPYMIPTKVVCSGNPGGKGHKWVKRRFIDTTVLTKDIKTNRPVKVRDHIEYIADPRDTSGATKIKSTIKFIPSSWRDNVYLNRSYVASLMRLPEAKRKMDMDGNWDVVAGRMFDEFIPDVRDKGTNVIEPGVIANFLREQKQKFDVYISIDWGYKPSYHSALWHIVTADKQVFTFMSLYGQELVFEEFVAKIKDMSQGFDIEATCLPHDMFRQGDIYRDNTGKIIGETKSDVFENAGLNPISIASGKGKVALRYDKIHSAFTMTVGDVKVFKISTACVDLLEEIEYAVHDEINPEVIDSSCKDHALDAYGHFLVFFSEDIAPIESEREFKPDLTRIQQVLKQHEEKVLNDLDQEEYIITMDDYDILY